MSSRQLHLNVNLLHSGVYASAWRLPDSDPRACFDVGHYVRVAQIAERGKLDAIFLADTPAITDRIDYRSFMSLEPTIVLATVAAATSHIGLIATASTTYNEPYNIARRFATLDLASGGRAGWNAVTTADAAASRNFGLPNVLEHKARYDRAKEFAEVVHALWDSWEDDAFVGDKASARFVDTSKVHPIEHRGTHYSVAGPLNVPRSPQGRPVTVQAGGSSDGRDLAAAQAEAVFTLAQTIEEGVAYARDLRTRAVAYGRAGEFDRHPARARHRDRQHRSGSQAAAGRTLGTGPDRIQPRAPGRHAADRSRRCSNSTSLCPTRCLCRPTPTTPCSREP